MVAMWLTGCIVHQFPEEPAVDPTLVKVHVLLHPAGEMTLYDNGNPMVDTKKAAFEPKEKFDVDTSKYIRRYIVEVQNKETQPQSIFRKAFVRSTGDTSALMLDFSLHAGVYNIYAWQDYVDKATEEDKYYNTDRLDRIHIPSATDYVGSTDLKDANAVSGVIDLSEFHNVYFGSKSCEFTLIRPMAKVVFVTTDINKFWYRKQKEIAQAAEVAQATDAEVKELAASINTVIRLVGYYPTGYNVFTDKPNDAEMGYSYEATPFLCERQVVLGFDYVFVGTSPTSVTASVMLYDEEGTLINNAAEIQIPIERNKVTVIMDEFLTRRYTPGVGVDPNYDGEYNIPFAPKKGNN